MQSISFTSSSSSSSSSAHSSGDDCCHRAEKGMSKFEHLHQHLSPPPPLPHFKAKIKHDSPRCHCPPPLHHRRSEDYHHFSPDPPQFPDHHRHEKGKLRVKPPKASKKIRKLHHKLIKACKLPKGARHGRLHNYMHCFPPEERFLRTHIGNRYYPGCSLHSMEVGFHHHDRPRRHVHPHPPGPRCIKLDGAEALVEWKRRWLSRSLKEAVWLLPPPC